MSLRALAKVDHQLAMMGTHEDIFSALTLDQLYERHDRLERELEIIRRLGKDDYEVKKLIQQSGLLVEQRLLRDAVERNQDLSKGVIL